MIMSILDTALFATPVPATLGVGFHNVGSGVLRASNEALVKQVERHYGERCGHLPLDAWNVRVLVEQHRFQYEDKTYPVTVSLGVASTSGGEALTPFELVRQADDNLYQAKREGRNRVVS